MDDEIRINCIAPGLIRTEFAGPLWKGNEALHPKSYSTPEFIGSVAATICSKDGTFMNGETYAIHGGFAKL